MTQRISVELAKFTVASGSPRARQLRLGEQSFPGMHDNAALMVERAAEWLAPVAVGMLQAVEQASKVVVR